MGEPASNLPAQLSSFVGREGEIRRVHELLGQARLVTLTGAGGVGKSRLALRLAQDVASDFTDGVWLVELAPLVEPSVVTSEVASVLGLEEQDQASVLGYLSQRSLLLLLDNCEHLIAACAELSQRILESCARVRILATSREPLQLPGEVTWRVPSLPLPTATTLFGERARAAAPDFQFSDQNADAIAQICRRLDGMPLAIELAAARVRALSPTQIAQRLDDRFVLLTSGVRTALPRQQTLRATVDWSYALLTEPQQRLFCALSVFSGGWTLEAAESVCGLPTLELLTQLVERSLVLAEPHDNEMRYTQLETLRQYAAEKLAEHGDEEEVRERHAAWCVTLAEQAATQLNSPDQVLWLDRLEREHDNIRSALRWAEQHGSELQVRLSNALWQFWYIRGYLAEGAVWVDAAARRTDVPLPLRARALKAAGSMSTYRYNFERAAELDREAIAIARSIGDSALVAACTMNLANSQHDLGQHEAADALYTETLHMMTALGNTYNVALTLLNQADLARVRGDFGRAEAMLLEALPLFQQHGDTRRMARTEMNLSFVALQQHDLVRAQELGRRALAAFRDLGFKPGLADGFQLLAGIAAGGGDPRRAARLFGAYEALQERVARPVGGAGDISGELQQASLRRVETALGKAAAKRERASGRAMDLDEAIAFALAESEAVVVAPRPVLTAREQEVALLLAHGLTNRQIAERLVLSERTADAHVRNIFDKLGVNARAQVAVWAAREGFLNLNLNLER